MLEIYETAGLKQRPRNIETRKISITFADKPLYNRPRKATNKKART
jgi:hypothetical protein